MTEAQLRGKDKVPALLTTVHHCSDIAIAQRYTGILPMTPAPSETTVADY